MKKFKMQPYPVASNQALAQWQSAVAKVAKEQILEETPNIDHEKLSQKIMTHPMVQGTNYHVEQAESGTNKLTLDHVKDFLPTSEKGLDLEPEVHAYLSQQHFNNLVEHTQKHGRNTEKLLAKVPPAEFPYSDYAVAQWAKCAAIWLVDGNPIPSPYVNVNDNGGPSSNFGVITIPEDSKIAVLGDFGTGQNDAVTLVVAMLQQLNPDFIVHLGDIYYSGTQSECEAYVNTFRRAFEIAGRKVPVFSIPGNHEYYAGGSGFFDRVLPMNSEFGFPEYEQPASYFCLRTEDSNWQFLGMDTGYTSVKNFNVAHPTHLNASYSPWLEFNEASWHQNKLSTFAGNTVLFSHHQLFSASSVINNGTGVKYQTGSDKSRSKYLNENLLEVFKPYFSKVAGWFWGHEHSVEIFEGGQEGLRKGRLIGNSGYQEWQGQNPYQSTDSPYKAITPQPELDVTDISWLGKSYNFYDHGFAMITLDGSEAKADYYEFPVFSPSSKIPSKIPTIQKFAYRTEKLDVNHALLDTIQSVPSPSFDAITGSDTENFSGAFEPDALSFDASSQKHNLKVHAKNSVGQADSNDTSLVQLIKEALIGGQAVEDFFEGNFTALNQLYETVATGGDSVWLDGTNEKTGLPMHYVNDGKNFLSVNIGHIDHDVLKNGTGSTDNYKQAGSIAITLTTDQGTSVQAVHIVEYAGLGLGGFLTTPALTKYIIKPALRTMVRFIKNLVSKVFKRGSGSASDPNDAENGANEEAETAAAESGEETSSEVGVFATVLEYSSEISFVVGVGVFAVVLIIYLLEKQMTDYVKFYNATSEDVDFGICWLKSGSGAELAPAKIGETSVVKKMGSAPTPPGVISSDKVIYRSDSTVINTDSLKGIGFVMNAKAKGDFPGFKVMVDVPSVGDNSLYIGFGNNSDCKTVWDHQSGKNTNLTAVTESGKYKLQIATNANSGESPNPYNMEDGYNYEYLIVLTDGTIEI